MPSMVGMRISQHALERLKQRWTPFVGSEPPQNLYRAIRLMFESSRFKRYKKGAAVYTSCGFDFYVRGSLISTITVGEAEFNYANAS